MDSLNTILSAKNLEEPEEISKLKQFIQNEYKAKVVISISNKSIIISVNSSPLASSLRLRMPEIKKTLEINQPIRLRIS